MSQALENALVNPDHDEACRSLHDILSKGTIAKSPSLPSTAKACLEAFCLNDRPSTRRRWTGLTLARLIESRPEVVPHLRRDPGDLTRVGAVILGSTEAEEIKIVAGLIIRAGLAQGIKFTDFWSVEKVRRTASLFPTEANSNWMERFQNYLDALSAQVSLGGSSSELSILYPVALIAADGYKWRKPDASVPILLIEGQALTVVTPEPALHEVQFVRIPHRSIRDLRCQPYDAYDSQDRHGSEQPWEVVLQFHSAATTYEVNCEQRSGSELTIVMKHRNDAKECASSIKDILFAKADSNESTASSTLVLNGGSNGLSKGGVVEFQRAVRDGSTTRDSRRESHSKSDARDRVPPYTSQTKRGALPVVKKALLSNGRMPGRDAIQTDYEFPDHSPSIRRPANASSKRSFANRKSAATSSVHITKAAVQRSAALRPDSKSQEPVETLNGGGEGNVHDGEYLSSLEVPRDRKRKSKASISPIILESDKGKTTQLLKQQSDVFSIPQTTQDDEHGAKRGSKRTRRKAVTYKEDTSSEEDNVTDSEHARSRRAKRHRARPTKTAIKKKPLESSPVKTAADRKARQSKASTRPMKSLKGSLVANIQSKPSAKVVQKATASKVGDLVIVERDDAIKIRKSQDAGLTDAPDQENLSSEAHILGRLNDLDNDDEPGDIPNQDTEAQDGVVTRKRLSTSLTPSTPRSKQAELDHNETEGDVEAAGSVLVKHPPTNAPARQLQDPQSPCDSRTNGTMQAPPRPTMEGIMYAASPRTQQTSGRKRKLFDERQTPVNQLSKRSQSGMSENLELLSSNSKPTPASPHAPSTAISGHADRYQVNMDKEFGAYKIEKSDPFRRAAKKPKFNDFTRRLTGEKKASQSPENERGSSQHRAIDIGDSPSSSSSSVLQPVKRSSVAANDHIRITQSVERLYVRPPNRISHPHSRTAEQLPTIAPVETPVRLSQSVQHERQEGVDAHFITFSGEMEGDTLVDLEEPRLPETEAVLAHLKSSPPPMDDSPSSHSSTSAEPEPKTDPPVPGSEAEEAEWELGLQPYQRSLKDQLLRVSNRVLRHIVDNESAVNDIADTFAEDGQRSVDLFLQEHEKEFATIYKDIAQKKAKMHKASEKMLSKLRKERQEVLEDDL